MSFFAACLWAVLLLTTFVGWGELVARVLAPDRQVGWGERAAWGLAALVAAGGVLNLVSWASKPVLLLIVGLGVVGFAVSVSRDPVPLAGWPHVLGNTFQRDRVAGVGMVVAVVVLAVLFLGSASSRGGGGNLTATNFNPHDDFHGYFVFAQKLVETGSMGVDPFSERRLTSGLGGQTVLQAFVLAAVPIQHLHLLDPALGIIIAIGIVAAIGRSKGLAPRYVAGVILFVLAVAPPTVNTSAVGTALALMLALGAAIDTGATDDHRSAWRHACLVSLLAAALCALKSNLIVPAVVAVMVGYAARLVKVSPGPIIVRRFKELGAALVLMTVLIAPFMLSLRQSSGTFLYPILGRGYRGVTADPHALLPARELIGGLAAVLARPAFVGFALLGCALLVSRRRNRAPGWSSTAALVIAAVAGIVVAGVELGGQDLHRYAYAFVMPAMAVALIDVIRRACEGPRHVHGARIAVLIGLCGAALFVADPAWRTGPRYRELPYAILSGMRGIDLVAPSDVARLRALQRAVPAGAPILARLEWPFLLDFARNPVFVYDWPGGASPPPGMPTMKGAEPIARYLRALGIHYLAYSYAHEAGYSRRAYAFRLDPRNKAVPGWHGRTEGAHVREQAFYTFEFQDAVVELGRLYRHVHDDGDTFMLDLANPVHAPVGDTTARR